MNSAPPHTPTRCGKAARSPCPAKHPRPTCAVAVKLRAPLPHLAPCAVAAKLRAPLPHLAPALCPRPRCVCPCAQVAMDAREEPVHHSWRRSCPLPPSLPPTSLSSSPCQPEPPRAPPLREPPKPSRAHVRHTNPHLPRNTRAGRRRHVPACRPPSPSPSHPRLSLTAAP